MQKFVQKASLAFYSCYNIERFTLLNFIPILFGLGILFYFYLDKEPNLEQILYVNATLIALSLLFRRHLIIKLLLIALTISASGILIAKLRTDTQENYQLTRELKYISLQATISELQQQESGVRLVLQDVNIPKIKLPGKLEKIRISVRTNLNGAEVGDRISLKATLLPLSLPVLPASYDFAKIAYFKKLGAVGYAVSNIEIVEKKSAIQNNLINNFRSHYVTHLTNILGTQTGNIASALLVGEYGALSKDNLTAIREAGLAHVLAVSGMHISLVMGTIFVVLRKLCVYIPGFAEKYNTKKVAALISIFGSYIYLLISGSQIAATRAFCMGILIALAILLDRTIDPIRSLAVAACIILFLYPEAIINTSFHLSFSAVLGLIASYKIYQKYISPLLDKQSMILKLPIYFISLCFSSLVASIATAPFSIYHFNQFSTVSVLANLFAVPLTSFF